jgi:ABC-type nitrate/sulfonate/bicarbonate transport system permease component
VEGELIAISATVPSRRAVWIGRLILTAALAGLWQLLPHLSRTVADSIPTFTAMCSGLGQVLGDHSFWLALGRTVRSTVIGIGLCTGVGIVAGVLISAHRAVESATRFVIDFCRTVPPLAIVPLFLLVFGPSARMEVLLVFAVGVWPVLVQTLYGVRNVDPELMRTARSFGLPLWRRLLFVMGPAAMPYVAAGVRICATLCLLLAIGTELIAGVPGLGQEILLRQQAGTNGPMFALILLTGCLGAVVSLGLSFLERRLLSWHYRPRAAQ